MNGKRRESDNHSNTHELLLRDLALLSSHDSRSEEREPREDNTRRQDYEVSLEFSRRGTCGENWGETTKSEAQKQKAYSERAAPTSPAPEGEGEEGARPSTPDNSPEAPPPLPLDRDRAGGEETPPDKAPGAP